MATRRMLVDAIHPEETRVVVTSGSRLEEFDFESAARRQLRGNIYLAKVTRVEPSLQAAFVDYGGNRHGFLAFSEIHPDYYQIPQADREALLAEEEEDEVAEAQSDDLSGSDQPSILDIDEPADEPSDDGRARAQASDNEAPSVASDRVVSRNKPASDTAGDIDADEDQVEQVGAEDAMEEVPQRRRKKKTKSYKIQEVIKRRQVLLVQVVKEERGNKGAALTTYLSLAGRYSVLMPNTARGGGISRKITNAADRKRLKEVANELDVQKGMGVILRTAGASRTKAEVKRDFEYLLRLWENVRSLTLESTAPCLVYEEGSLIKRSIRDLYNKEISEVQVSGEEAYREAKDFMRMIMPSHAKNVQPYREEQPIFSRHGVEQQLDSMFSPQVTLPSGGYIVINPTEALVSVDVNSGKATKEHNIEDTALQTNLEAAAELARQLRLRDMAGLVVIDFIDMEEKRNIRAVERKLKDNLKTDRARIQVGRISHFGLLEMSRQRIRFGVLESSTITCPVCTGTGLIRSVDSHALMVMRAIEDHVMRKQGQSINVKVPTEVALYLLNAKRSQLLVLEQRFGLAIAITAENHLLGDQFTIEKGDLYETSVARQTNHVKVDSAPILAEIEEDDVIDEVEDESEAEAENEVEVVETTEQDEDRSNRRRGKRRRRGGRDRDRDRNDSPAAEAVAKTDEDKGPASDNEETDGDDDDQPKKRRRRGRRGGRRNRRTQDEDVQATENAEAGAKTATPADDSEAPAMDAEAAAAIESSPSVSETTLSGVTEEKPKKRVRRPRRKKPEEQAEASTEVVAQTSTVDDAKSETPEEKPKPRRGRKSKAQKDAEAQAAANAEPISAGPAEIKPVDTAPNEVKAEEKPSSRPERGEKKLPEEGIIVTSSSPAKSDDSAPAEPAKKVKKGWWQRNILGS